MESFPAFRSASSDDGWTLCVVTWGGTFDLSTSGSGYIWQKTQRMYVCVCVCLCVFACVFPKSAPWVSNEPIQEWRSILGVHSAWTKTMCGWLPLFSLLTVVASVLFSSPSFVPLSGTVWLLHIDFTESQNHLQVDLSAKTLCLWSSAITAAGRPSLPACIQLDVGTRIKAGNCICFCLHLDFFDTLSVMYFILWWFKVREQVLPK